MNTRVLQLGAWLPALASISTAVSGCTTPAPAATATAAAPVLGPAAAVQVGDDTITLLRSGVATFRVLSALIEAARSSVDVEVYEFQQRPLADALIADHRRGVAVTVIDDPSELSSVSTAARLRRGGVDVVDYPVRAEMIDHVKLLIVDAAVAVIGGINWGIASPANHDYDVEIRGPAVHNLQRVFVRDLVTCGRELAVPEAIADPDVVVAATLPGTEIRPLALDLINGATHTLHLELFVLTDTGIVDALLDAQARGVEVAVLLDPSQRSSVPAYLALQAAGVPVRWYRSHGELLHAKAIVADATSLLFGSANWSGGGFARNHELDVELPDAPVVAAQMLAQMSVDWQWSS